MEQNRTHPMILTAAAAVIITCGLAAASMTGLLPSSQAKEAQTAELSKTELIEKATASSNKPITEAPALAAAPSGSYSQYQPVNAAPYESPSPRRYTAPREAEHAICRSCGKVIAVNPIKIQGEGTGVGAVAGGLAGALLGKQLGNGNGQKAFTVAGAVGGAYLGNNIEKERRSRTVYDVRVRFEDGRIHKYRETHAAWQVGDRVRVENGRLSSNF